jgi:hypothetical protein
VAVPKTGVAVVARAAGLVVVSIAVSTGTVVNQGIVGVVASSAEGAEVVAGSSGSDVAVPKTGVAVVARAAGLVVVSIAVSTGAVVNQGIDGVVASSAEGAAVVAGSSGSDVDVLNTGGAVVGSNGKLVVVSIAVSAGDVVIPSIGAGVETFAAHPSILRSSMQARCSGYHHALPGLSNCFTSAPHSCACSSSMQQITSPVGFLHTGLTSQGETPKQSCASVFKSGQTARQSAIGSIGCGVVLTSTAAAVVKGWNVVLVSAGAVVVVGARVVARVGAGVGCGVGQANMLHSIVSVSLPQSFCSPAKTNRSRVFMPPAQSAVHDPHSCHSPTRQLGGQRCMLHSTTSSTSVSLTAQKPPY